MKNTLLKNCIVAIAILLLGRADLNAQTFDNLDSGKPVKPIVYSQFGFLQNMGSTINGSVMDQLPVLAPNGLSLYFSSNRTGGLGAQDIYVSQRPTLTSAWGPPQNLGLALNTSSNDTISTLSPDGLGMFMQSTRPGGMGGADIYITTRADTNDDFGWTAPVNIGTPINTSSNDYFGNLFLDPKDGTQTLYFNSDRPGGMGSNDIYQSLRNADGSFNPPSAVSELNSSGSEERTSISRDGLEIFFSSNRLIPTTDQAIFVATRRKTSKRWSEPDHIENLNSSGSNAQPLISDDGTLLFFVSNRVGGFGLGDLHSATRVSVKRCAVVGSSRDGN